MANIQGVGVVPSTYDYSQFTPIDSTGSAFNVFKSAYVNIKYGPPTNTQYPVQLHDMCNLPGICYNLYGDTSFWRGLISFNGIVDPLQEIYPGLILNVPSKSDIIAYLAKNQQANNPTLFI